MAKKKLTETTEGQNPEVETPEVNTQPEIPENEPEVNEAPKAEGEPEPEATDTEPVVDPEIPAKALAYLKRHPEDKEVYIDRLGGVFPANTSKVFVKDAVLYQNPYFK